MSRNKYPKFENKIENIKNERNKQNYVDLSDIDISKCIDYIAWPNKKKYVNRIINKPPDNFLDLVNKSNIYWQSKLHKDKSKMEFKNSFESDNNTKNIIYELDTPLIITKNIIFTIKEYFAAKKIFNLLRKHIKKKSRKNTLPDNPFMPISYSKYDKSYSNISISSDI